MQEAVSELGLKVLTAGRKTHTQLLFIADTVLKEKFFMKVDARGSGQFEVGHARSTKKCFKKIFDVGAKPLAALIRKV
jgi:hypothetical protein